MTANNNGTKSPGQGSSALRLAGRIANTFIAAKLTPLVIIAALLLGAFSILQTPREEEPQIVVPMLDVFVQMPGASSDEVAQRVSLPMERLLREVPGVEQPLIKTRSIDDVPIMALTLWGKDYDSFRLRRIAAELENSVKPLEGVSETKIIGGQPRQIRVVLDTQRLAGYGLTPGAVVAQLQGANTRAQAGSFSRDNREFQVQAGLFFTTAEDLRQVVIGVHAGRP